MRVEHKTMYKIISYTMVVAFMLIIFQCYEIARLRGELDTIRVEAYYNYEQMREIVSNHLEDVENGGEKENVEN